MVKTKESSIYLNFIVKNYLLVLGCGVLVSLGTFAYISKQPVIFHQTESFEFSTNQSDLSQVVIMTDQVVSKLRTPQVVNVLTNSHQDSSLNISFYKSGPFLINTDISSTLEESVNMASINLDQYMKNTFNLLVLGKPDQYIEKPKTSLFTVLGFGLGNFLGLILSLIKSYLKKH